MQIIGVIPARYGSKRFPGKPLAKICDKPMVQWVYEKAAKTKYLNRMIVATDDVRIMRTVWSFGGEAMLTPKNIKSGTDRVAEVCNKIAADVVVNIQGDEPLMATKTIDAILEPFRKDARLLMTTAACPFKVLTDISDPNAVKVVCDSQDNALYFSRSPIPYSRNPKSGSKTLRHMGIYAYRRDFLLRFTKWPQTALELAESLEQLRALERGIRIRVVRVNQESIGVDTQSDLEKVTQLFK